ncbi:uncharacterized protein SETTUDRAFT_35269 [Exserohilum turcica Et28A]|uniref:Uncharacterized protein n=1 Tax=Exserohilum turcicum (strain 28A) TaxID=671987 RepID=R0JYV7_EXST2|nr:uncharacterized protein SETTUDRAFT_35269 [Exserohilum turcica Et28A]EOA81432.1 hypothetical protein SETTUDRAFT_35269 [Exserohilum turcica Et28A]
MASAKHSSPTLGTGSPFKSHRPPGVPSRTAELWDEYEKQAIEKAKEREDAVPKPQAHFAPHLETSQIREQRDGSTARSSFDFRFRRAHAAAAAAAASSTTNNTGDTTPPLSPIVHSFTSKDLQELHRSPTREEAIIPTASSPRRTSFCRLPPHLTDHSNRSAAMQLPVPLRVRTKSLVDPNEPALRLQITQQSFATLSHLNSPPMTPTSSPPWASQSSSSSTTCSTRRSSATTSNLLPKPRYLHTRNDSGTPSEFSAMYQTVSTATTPPASVHRFGYPLQNTMSAWDDWDSDEDDDDDAADRPGLTAWMGRRRGKSRGAGSSSTGGGGGGGGGKASIDQGDSSGEEPPRKSKQEERIDRVARIEAVAPIGPAGPAATTAVMRADRLVALPAKERVKRQGPSGFVRVLSCGCMTE